MCVVSWKKGSETLPAQHLEVILSTKNQIFEQEILSESGRHYLLRFEHNPYQSLSLEHWEISLREITSKNKKKRSLGKDVLRQNEPGHSIDYFPKEDLIGVLYPEEKPFVYDSDMNPLYGEGYGFYYFKTKRVIKVENYCFVYQVGDYKFNTESKTKLDLFEISIDITPAIDADCCDR